MWSRAFRILAGFELATICLLLLFAATFFGTIEQTHVGLYQTLQKYFDMEAIFIIPELKNGKIVPLPLPGTAQEFRFHQASFLGTAVCFTWVGGLRQWRR